MADRNQKTEKATAKRHKDLRRQGRVARSSELGAWFSLLGLTALLPVLGARASHIVVGLTSSVTNAIPNLSNQDALSLFAHGWSSLLSAVLPIVAVATGFGLLANFGQVGLHISPGALGFRWSRISPWSGIKRILSPQGVFDLTKSAARLLLLIAIGYSVFRSLMNALLGSGTLPISATLDLAGAGVLGLVRDIALAALVIAGVDFVFQRRRFESQIKMTKQELRDEQRETDGNPEVRREQRRRRRRMTRMQILAAVNQAHVIVVNPTHFAVALTYDRSRDRAPRVICKGEDETAMALKSAAIAYGVPVVESPVLARALHGACEIGDEVPASLYETVARLLAFVYRLSPAARVLVDVHHMAA